MTTYLVWDEQNGSEQFGIEVESPDLESAAIAYAEHDVDGSIDGVYFKPHTICVKSPHGGSITRFAVTVEASPVFHATETDTRP